MIPREAEDLLRECAPQVLGALVRRYGHFDLAEDAVQESLLAAASRWPDEGIPASPRGWLITVASRRLVDLLRAEQARRRREDTVAARKLPQDWLAPAADAPATAADDTLVLLFMCCHPALTPAAQTALTLRAVGGLSTAEIARAFLVSEQTMTRRITRAKQRIKDSGVPFALPGRPHLAGRLAQVLRVLYLIFNEGYARTAGEGLVRAELSGEAIRLTRLLYRLMPDDSEVTGLLALMLLTDARRPARTGQHGELIPMAEQDRRRWDAGQIAEGIALLTSALPRGATGPYQLQAAIAALHDEAPSAEQTDWPQILALYDKLLEQAPSPVVALNRAVAVAMVHGPAAGLDLLDSLAGDELITAGHPWHAVRAHLLERTGDRSGARACYRAAAARTTNLAQQRFLHAKAAGLADPGQGRS